MGVVVQAVAVVLLAAAPKGVMTLGGVAFCFGLLMADDSAVLIAGLMMEAGGSAVLDFWIVNGQERTSVTRREHARGHPALDCGTQFE